MKKVFIKVTQIIAITGLLISPKVAKSEIIEGEAILCSNRGWETEIAVSTDQFNAAICVDKTNYQNYNSFYIGQNKDTNESIVLPVVESFVTADRKALVYKAVNGRYTYQIYATCRHVPPQGDDWASLSVFNNGERMLHYKLDRYMTSTYWCMDSFGQFDEGENY